MRAWSIARLISSAVIVAAAAVALHLGAQGVDEYQMKAAFVVNFPKFVEWPPEAARHPADPTSICVAGDSPIVAALQRAANDKSAGTPPIVVRKISEEAQAETCQIVFVSSAARRRWHVWLADCKASILTVGETDDFIADRGVINLKIDGDRIRIQIGLAAAERERLRISSKLLSLAQVVK